MNKNLFKIWWFITAILLIMLSIQIQSVDLRGGENQKCRDFYLDKWIWLMERKKSRDKNLNLYLSCKQKKKYKAIRLSYRCKKKKLLFKLSNFLIKINYFKLLSH